MCNSGVVLLVVPASPTRSPSASLAAASTAQWSPLYLLCFAYVTSEVLTRDLLANIATSFAGIVSGEPVFRIRNSGGLSTAIDLIAWM